MKLSVNRLSTAKTGIVNTQGGPVERALTGARRAEPSIEGRLIQQKVSGGWRILFGKAFMAVRSYIATARKQGINVLHALRRAFEGDPWLPAATGPPVGLAAAA